jgi:hypothetical protein
MEDVLRCSSVFGRGIYIPVYTFNLLVGRNLTDPNQKSIAFPLLCSLIFLLESCSK